MLGVGDGSLLFELLKNTKVVVYCLEPDAVKRDRMRVSLDEAGETGAPNKALVKEVKGVGPTDTVVLSLEHVAGKPPLLCGIEVARE